MKSLTENMKEALVAVGYGVRKYADGYRSEDDMEKVDGRSLDALKRRGLIDWTIWGGYSPQICLRLTKEGEEIFEELRGGRLS